MDACNILSVSGNMLFFPDENEKVQNELKEVRVNYYSQKELYEDLADKMKFFSKVPCLKLPFCTPDQNMFFHFI